MAREADKTIDHVLTIVCRYYGLTQNKLMDRHHLRERHIVRYLSFRMTHYSLSQVALATRADTTTKVAATILMIEKEMASDELFRTEIDALKAKILES